MKNARFLLPLLCLASLSLHAQSGYQLDHPKATWNLPASLNEISGITWVDNEHLLAIEDLTPTLYLINLSRKPVVELKSTFRKTDQAKFDVEDIALVNGTAYVLWSHGDLFAVRNWRQAPQTEELDTRLSKKNNTEGLCYDPKTGHLLIACKNASGVDDAKKSTRSIYAYDPVRKTLLPDPVLVINHKEIKAATGNKAGFYPSAIAVHPQSGNFYVLSTRETKGLAVFDRSGKLLSFQAIKAGLMPQPEGLCFGSDGTLYISTEARKGQPARVLAFAPAP
ncbi:SdiA-regulated domain-containing protein [Flaviaesturariibacter terrae]